MKTLLLLIAAAGLSGCAVYPVPGNEVYGGGAAPYVIEQPVYIQGGVSYGSYPRPYVPYVYPRAHYRGHPGVAPHRGPRPNAHPGRGARDRDRDGIPNRLDRDRDGDGVRNRHDRRPNDPGRR